MKDSAPSRGKKSHHKATKPKSKTEAASDAKGLLEMIEMFAVMRLGVEAAFTDTERIMIEPPLTKLLEKYGNLADKYAGWLDPVMLGVGVFAYANRVAKLANPKEPPPTPPPPANQAPPTPPPMGNHSTPVINEEAFFRP